MLGSLSRPSPPVVFCGGAAWLGSVSRPCPPRVLGLVLLLSSSWPPLNSVNSVVGLCGCTLSSSCPRLGRAPEPCQLCGWALWLGLVLLLSSSWPRPRNSVNSVAGLRGWALSSFCLVLAAPLNSVNSLAGLCVEALFSRPCPPLGRAGLCVQALPSCCPSLGRAPELCQLCGWTVWFQAFWRSETALQRERQRKINLKRKRKTERERERERERDRETETERERELVCYGRLTGLLSSSCPLCCSSGTHPGCFATVSGTYTPEPGPNPAPQPAPEPQSKLFILAEWPDLPRKIVSV